MNVVLWLASLLAAFYFSGLALLRLFPHLDTKGVFIVGTYLWFAFSGFRFWAYWGERL